MSIRNGVKDSLKHLNGHNVKEKLKKVYMSLQDVIFKEPQSIHHKTPESSKDNSEDEAANAEAGSVEKEMNKTGLITKDRKNSIRNN